MKYNKLIYQIATTQLVGFGPIKTKQLILAVEELEDIFTLSIKKLSQITGFSNDLLKQMQREEALLKSERIVNELTKFDIEVVFFTSPNYPRRLKQCDDAPLVIYTKGAMDLNNSRFVAVVGTRDASEYGKRICHELIHRFVGTDIVVVSGMAYGIDIAIHQLCVQLGVPTIGVMAHGLEIVYPNLHRSTAKKMLNQGGLISEYPPHTKPDRENFPMRNRIVAGLCDATIVVESKLKGGSLITANLANDYNRDVFAYPGNVFDESSEGCNNLIATNKAHLIRNANDFLEKMGWNLSVNQSVQRPMFPDLSKDEEQVVHYLEKNGTQNIDVLSMELNFSSSQLSVLLFQLEMHGLVTALPGNRCQLI